MHVCVCYVFHRVQGEDVRLMLWDTAGQEEFDAITKAYYRGKMTYLYCTSYKSHSLKAFLRGIQKPTHAAVL